MLVCSVVRRPPRTAITAAIAEAAVASDASTTGNIVFATLVDDPANVRDRLDAYLGEIMLEAASANSTVNAGLTYRVAIDEATTALAAQEGQVPSVYAIAIVEAASAGAAEDASISAAAVTRDAMIAGTSPVFVNSTGTRDAVVINIMLNE